MAGLLTIFIACSPNVTSGASTTPNNLTDSEVIVRVQDWLGGQTYERFVGASLSEAPVDGLLGHRTYNCYNGISLESRATWRVEPHNERYEVSARLSDPWRGHLELTWSFSPRNGEVVSTHGSKYC